MRLRSSSLSPLCALLVAGLPSLRAAAPASSPAATSKVVGTTMAYTPGLSSLYTLDLSGGSDLTVQSAGLAPGSQVQSARMRLTGQLQTVAAGQAASGNSLLQAQLQPGLKVYRLDPGAVWTDITANVNVAALQEAFVIEQGPDGSVASVSFNGPAADSDTESARNALKGVSALLDLRLVQAGGATTASCTDSMGSFPASFSSADGRTIQRSVAGYSSLSSGFGLQGTDSTGAYTTLPSSFTASGTATYVVGTGNRIQSVSLNQRLNLATLSKEDTKVQPNDFCIVGQSSVSGTLTLSSEGSASVPDLSAFQQRESLQALPVDASSASIPVGSGSPANPGDPGPVQSVAMAAVQSVLEAPGDRQRVLALGSLLHHRGGFATLREALDSASTKPDAALALVEALGMAHRPEAQPLLARLAGDPLSAPELRARALVGAISFAKPAPELVEAAEAALRSPDAGLRSQALVTLGAFQPRLEAQQPLRAAQLLQRLEDATAGALTEEERMAGLSALSVTGQPRALQALRAGLQDPSPRVRAFAERRVATFLPRSAAGSALASLSTAAVTSSSGVCADLQARFGAADWSSCQGYAASAGNSWIGGDAWASAGAFDKEGASQQAGLLVEGGVDIKALGGTFGLASFEWWAATSTNDGTKRVEGGSVNANGNSLPSSFSSLADGTATYNAQVVHATYEFTVQVSFLTVDFDLGFDLNYALSRSQAGMATASNGAYASITPSSSVTLSGEASVGIVCLRIGLQLQGTFLHVAFPERLDLEVPALAPGTGVNPSLTSTEQRTAWALALNAVLHYCIGSDHWTLWSDSAATVTDSSGIDSRLKSDLTVTGLSWPNDNLDTSAPIPVQLTVLNQGPYYTPLGASVSANLVADGSVVGSVVALNAQNQPVRLAPGQSFSGTVTWSPAIGDHTLTAIADPNNRFNETSESNNSLSKAVHVYKPLPDLQISAFTAPNPIANNAVQVQVTVLNAGPGAASELQGDNLPPDFPDCTVQVSGPGLQTTNYNLGGSAPLAANASRVVTISVPVTNAALVHTISAMVDANAEIPEKNEQNNGASLSYNFAVDTQPPTVTAQVTGTSGTITLGAAVSDNVGVTRVDYSIDGILRYSTAAPFTVSYDSHALVNGSHTLKAQAYDAAGNTASSTISFTVNNSAADTTPPTVSVSELGSSDTITFRATATDNVGVTSLTYYIDGVAKGTSSTAPYEVAFNSRGLANGSHSVVGKASDAAGNVGSSAAVAFTVNNPVSDTQPPTATASESGTSGTITLGATATDNVGVTSVSFYVDGALKGTDSTAPYAMSLDSTTLANGSHSLVAKASDAAGNVGSSTAVAFSISNPAPDTQAPIVSSYESGGSGTISFTANYSDNVGVTKVEYYVDGALKGSSTTAPFSVSYDSRNLSNGLHSLVAKAYDAAGNVGTSSNTTNFSINNGSGDTQAPVLSNLNVTSNVVHNTDGTHTNYGLHVTATDNVGVSRVDFYVGGNFAGTANAGTGGAYNLQTQDSFSGMGSALVKAVAYDAAGNSANLTLTYNFVN